MIDALSLRQDRQKKMDRSNQYASVNINRLNAIYQRRMKMNGNETVAAGKWNEIKGEIQAAWGNLTGDEIDRAKGNIKSIYGTIQQKYGHKVEEIEHKIDGIMAKFNTNVEKKVEAAKTNTDSPI
jgi:uncharacterized protein YjbJ (UPF0337 family)